MLKAFDMESSIRKNANEYAADYVIAEEILREARDAEMFRGDDDWYPDIPDIKSD